MTTQRLPLARLAIIVAITGITLYAAADDKTKPGQARATPPAQDAEACPMREGIAPVADVTVEMTDKGALIRLTAKEAADVKKVQEMAQKLAKHMSSGCDMKECPMMEGGGMKHGGMMGGKRGGMMGGQGTGPGQKSQQGDKR